MRVSGKIIFNDAHPYFDIDFFYVENVTPNFKITVPIADLFESDWFFITTHIPHLVHNLKSDSGEKYGWLLVYYPNFWKSQLAHNPDARRFYVRTDLFDGISLKLVRNHIKISNITIYLNNKIILYEDFSPLKDMPTGRILNLRENILNYRKRKFIYNPVITYPPTLAFLDADFYDRDEILGSGIVFKAILDYAQTWSGKYVYKDGHWDKNNDGTWGNNYPGYCGWFMKWVLEFLYGGDPVWEHDNPDRIYFYFERYNRYLKCSDEIDYYVLLKDLDPGTFVQLNHGHHQNMFLYWLQNKIVVKQPFKTTTDMCDALSIKPDDPDVPGNFDPNNCINWYKSIGGNQSSSLVVLRTCAVVKIAPNHREVLDDYKEAEKKAFCLFWHPKCNDGFGRIF